MSFLSTLQTIGKYIGIGLGVVKPFVPMIDAIPTVGPIFDTVFSVITMLEGLIPDSGQGAAKKALAVPIVAAAHPGVSPTAIGSLIDDMVAALNALQQAGVTAASLAPTKAQ